MSSRLTRPFAPPTALLRGAVAMLCALAALLPGLALPLHTLLAHGGHAHADHAPATHAHEVHHHAHGCNHAHSHAAAPAGHGGGKEGAPEEVIVHAAGFPAAPDEQCLICQQLLAGAPALAAPHAALPAVTIAAAPASAPGAVHAAPSLRLAPGRAPPAA